MALKPPRKQRNHQTDHHQHTHTLSLSLSLSLQVLPMEEDVDPPVGCAKKKPRRDVDLQTETALFQTVLMCNALAMQEERSYKKMMMALPPLWQVQISVGRAYGWNLDTYRLILVLVSKN
jgi:hypothetical protein